MDVKVLDIVGNCNTAAEGQALFAALWPCLNEDKEVTISFEDVAEVTSSFINASIVQLVLKRNYESIETKLTIADISKQSADVLRRCIRNATEHKAA